MDRCAICGIEDISVKWYEERKEKVCDTCARLFAREAPELTTSSNQDFTF